MKRREGSRGQGLVEFAMILPIILVLVFGILDLGRAVYAYNTLSQAARQASRMAMVDQNVTTVRDTAIDFAPTLGLTSSNVNVCFKDSDTAAQDCSSSADDCPQATRVIGCLAIVETDLGYVPMTPIIGSIIGTVQLSSTSIQPIEYVCPNSDTSTCP